MYNTQQVIHRFYRIKGSNWYFHEDGIPIRHGTIP